MGERIGSLWFCHVDRLQRELDEFVLVLLSNLVVIVQAQVNGCLSYSHVFSYE